jgi:hypothetical protein
MIKHVVFRIIAGLILLAAIAGIAIFAYQAGVTHGTTANLQLPTSGNGLPFYPHYGMHPFMGFGFFGVLFAFFLLFLDRYMSLPLAWKVISLPAGNIMAVRIRRYTCMARWIMNGGRTSLGRIVLLVRLART